MNDKLVVQQIPHQIDTMDTLMDRLRLAFAQFVIAEMVGKLQDGAYDDTLRMFISAKVAPEMGDEIAVAFEITVGPEVLFMLRALAGVPVDEDVDARIWRFWEKRRKR